LGLGGTECATADSLEEALARNDFAAAEVELEALAAEWAEALAENPAPDARIQYGLVLQALGTVERQAGKAAEAVEHLREALKLLADADPVVRVDAEEALALALQDLGELSEALDLLRAVVDLRKTRPEAGAELAASLDHLALALLADGDYPEAGALLQATLEDTPPDDRVGRARRLGYLGRYLHTIGSHARAVALFREALELDAGGPELRLSLTSQLALAELRLGRAESARQGMEAAASGARELFRDSSRPFLAAPYLLNLGALDLSLGDALQAKASFAEALELLEASLPADHPSLIVPLNNLGCAEQAEGNLSEAAVHLQRAAALQQKHLPRLHLRVAETARNLARNALLAKDPDAFEEIDRATGLGIELLGELLQHGSESERLNFLQRLDLVSLPCATGDPERIARVLIASKARLLDAMLAADPSKPAATPGWQAVRDALPQGSAFIDAVRYTTEGDDAGVRYGAVILLPGDAPKWVPLGSEEELQRWLAALRQRLAWRAGQLSGQASPPPPLKLRTILRALHREFWEPLARELPPGTQDIAFSPDGALHFLPLAGLLDPSMQPLCVVHRQLTSVASARDLLGSPAATSLTGRPWAVLGVSEFPKSAAPTGGDALLELLAELNPMPGTADETRRLRAMAPRGSLFLQDERATEAALNQLPAAPGVLHLGCHAFFLGSDLAAGAIVDFDENADLLHAGGLLLHRAALRGPESPLISSTDDLLFPAEVARLPLRDTRLVTLSSCESGVGTAVNGEGLLGLRRGFALAGAREVLVALWPVSDRSTPAFMERFYQLALASDHPAQALWQAQREFLTAPGSDDDFEAAFLRFGPFVISQSTPLVATTATITARPASPWRSWKSLLLALPLAAFLAARFFKKRRPA
jgi:CHAT domain-containing protein/tetratricopeptide (TPR) repeat protein